VCHLLIVVVFEQHQLHRMDSDVQSLKHLWALCRVELQQFLNPHQKVFQL
jgi:hypothetical protein